jgi:hypothetical protein
VREEVAEVQAGDLRRQRLDAALGHADTGAP